MNIQSLYEQRQSFFLAPSSVARGGLIFCILVGIVAFIGGMYAGEATRTWGSYIFNLFFFLSIAIGGVAFSGMQDVIGAVWGRPIMRLHESFASFLPVALVMLGILFACIAGKVAHANDVYVWIRHPEMLQHFWGKRDWLVPGFMMARDLFALVLVIVLASWQMRQKLPRDLAFIKGDRNKAAELGAHAKDKLRYWSAPILVCYAVCFSLLAFDLTMSMSPTWYSTLWGGWSFAVMMQTLMAATLLFMFSMKKTYLGHVMKRQQFHDVGKLMHGFTIFFAYLTYAHILTYWYGNMPEETEYYIHRLHGPWLGIVIVAPLLVFVLPLFSLIPKAAKWTAAWTIPIASIILFAQWLIALLIVIPETVSAENWTLPWIEVGAFFGFLGLFLSCVFWFGKRFPMLSLGDPLLADALAEAH